MTWRKSGRAGFALVACAVVLAAVLGALPAAAETKVQFEAPTREGGKIKLSGLLDVPDGRGPFPAVVLLHDGHGFTWDLGVARYAAWAERLVQWGYVVLRVDSFGPRRISNPAVDGGKAPAQAVSLDAYAARAFLTRQTKVDGRHVGAMGWSLGAVAGLYLIDRGYRPKGVEQFQAVAAYYPYYPSLPREHDTPLLLLYGGDDADCPPSMVTQMIQSWSKGDRKIELTVKCYDKTRFGFDVEGLNEDFQGAHLEYDPAAAADATQQVKEFLARYLTP